MKSQTAHWPATALLARGLTFALPKTGTHRQAELLLLQSAERIATASASLN